MNPKLLELQQKLDALRAAKNKVNSLSHGPVVEKEAPVNSGVSSLSGQFTHLEHLIKDNYNHEQITAVDYALKGYDFNLTGAAGTGKTFTEKAVIHELIQKRGIDYFGIHDFHPNYLGDAPGFAIVAFTKVAVANSKKALRKDERTAQYAGHCMTIHKLLEYQPVYYIDFDAEGNEVEKMRFEPMRTAANPLKLKLLIVEEASMVDEVVLWRNLFDALPSDCQIIFVGDINQLKPVFGRSVFAYSLCKLRTVELTTIYRQGQDSDIILNAHHIKNGEADKIFQSEKMEFNIIEGSNPYKIDMDKAASNIIGFFKSLIVKELYNPDEDVILSPWNKHGLGTDNINTAIADYLGRQRDAVVYEIIAGREKWYLAVGDRVMVDRRYATIVQIAPNPKYNGKKPKPQSVALNRYGHYIHGRDKKIDGHIDDILAEEANGLNYDYSKYFDDKEVEDKKNSASHEVTVQFQDDEDETATLTTTGHYSSNVFSLGYALTVHKSQGSEWPRVFFVCHEDMKINLSREMLYTAVTRAQKECRLIMKKYLIDYAIDHAECRGQSLEEKIAWFTSGVVGNMDQVQVTKRVHQLEAMRA